MIYDVLVLGGGIVGMSTAYALSRQGLAVALIEQFEPGHRQGSSHGDGRIVRFNYSESIYVEMALLAYPAWERLQQAAGQKLLQKTGLIECGPPGSAPMRNSEANLRGYHLAYERLSAAVVGQRFPQIQIDEEAAVLYQPEGAVAFATPAVLALWRLFKDAGGTAVSGQQIERIEIQAGLGHLQSAENTWQARAVVLAGGAWSKRLAAQIDLNLPIEVTQETLAYFPPREGALDHRIGQMPVVIDYVDLESPFYSLPQVEVPGVKVGWHHSGPVIEADQPQSLIGADYLRHAGLDRAADAAVAARAGPGTDLFVFQYAGLSFHSGSSPAVSAGDHRGGILRARFQVRSHSRRTAGRAGDRGRSPALAGHVRPVAFQCPESTSQARWGVIECYVNINNLLIITHDKICYRLVVLGVGL